MKKLLMVAALAFSSAAFAQSGLKEDVDIIQSIYGKSKKDLVHEYMKPAEPHAAAFWKLYDEYEIERKALGLKKVQLLSEYADHYTTLTDEKADELATAMLKNNMDYEKLFSKYYGKIKKEIGALDAAKFMQLEIALQTEIRHELQHHIPFVGEIDRSKKN